MGEYQVAGIEYDIVVGEKVDIDGTWRVRERGEAPQFSLNHLCGEQQRHRINRGMAGTHHVEKVGLVAVTNWG
jgi:hypothetical protein